MDTLTPTPSRQSHGYSGSRLLRSSATDHVVIRISGAVLLSAFVALVLLVATSPGRFLYDEPYFARYIPLLHQHGFTASFLNSLPGTVGPLYSFVHIAFESFTHLQPVRMRLVNVFLVVVVAAMIAIWLKRQNECHYWVSACSVLVVPMTWVVAGMALSEMPAIVFVTMSLYLQLVALGTLGTGRSVVGYFVASGACLVIAVWGRQPYLLLVGVPVLAALVDRRLRAAALIFAGVVLAATVPLFIVWRGLVPPSHHFVQRGLSVTHGVISLGYTGVCFFLLAPRCRWLPGRVLLGAAVLTTIANTWFGGYRIYPLRSVVDRYLPRPGVSAYGSVCGSLFLSCGVAFLATLLWITWDNRQDLRQLTVNGGLLCVAASPLFIAHQYSSRYTAMSLPYLILAAQPWRRWGLTTVITTLIGCGAGFLSLLSYFLFAH